MWPVPRDEIKQILQWATVVWRVVISIWYVSLQIRLSRTQNAPRPVRVFWYRTVFCHVCVDDPNAATTIWSWKCALRVHNYNFDICRPSTGARAKKVVAVFDVCECVRTGDAFDCIGWFFVDEIVANYLILINRFHFVISLGPFASGSGNAE